MVVLTLWQKSTENVGFRKKNAFIGYHNRQPLHAVVLDEGFSYEFGGTVHKIEGTTLKSKILIDLNSNPIHRYNS
jgi:hypothetical protein